MKVTFEDCRRELLDRSNAVGREAYERWRRRPGYEAVIAFVEGFAHTRLFEIALEEVKTVQRKPLKDRAEHALGDVEMEEAIDQVEDALVPFAMQHLFHWYIEENGKLPTWTEFTTWVTKTKKGVWLTRLHEYLRSHPDLQDTPRLAIGRAIHWRVGKFYYSAIREVELLVRRRLGSMILQ